MICIEQLSGGGGGDYALNDHLSPVSQPRSQSDRGLRLIDMLRSGRHLHSALNVGPRPVWLGSSKSYRSRHLLSLELSWSGNVKRVVGAVRIMTLPLSGRTSPPAMASSSPGPPWWLSLLSDCSDTHFKFTSLQLVFVRSSTSRCIPHYVLHI